MKPTVITSGNSENPANHPDGSGMNSTGNTPHPANGGGTGNSSARQFPQFQSGFGFDPYLDDIFSDPAIRSRLNRFRDPFAFARKRCGPNEPNDDPHSRFFDDDDSDFFPSFGSFPTRRRAPSQGATGSGLNAASGSGAPNPFYDHIPAEFRHYIPDDFGFSHGRGAPQPAPQQAPPQPVHPQQFYEAYVQPPSPTYKQPPPQKAKLCDAAIQTEDLGELDGGKEAKNLKQYGMRNTVDLGQKSPQEECRGSRSQSAPPPEGSDQTDSTSTASNSQKTYPAAGGACAQQAPEFQPPQQQTQTFNQQASKGTQPMTPPHPPPRQPTTNQQYQPWRGQPQYQQPQYEQQQQETNASQTGGGFTRTVPIFFEGRAEPMTKRTAAPPRQNQQQSQKPKPDHPTPLNVQQQPPQQTDNQAPPPQTPHTTECINKIQGIQRDVLDLMAKVEQFTGIKNDKEYMFLDEMLTRNLLKLDTIDTNGKDNIRLARREAIKCIQASINVLEAKAEENAKTANSTVMVTSPQSETEGDQDRAEVGEQKVMEEEPINIPSENVAIPLPAPPAKETPTTEVSSADVENKIENKKDIENVVDEEGKIEEQVETTKETAEKIPEQPLIEKIESKDNKENIENPEIKDESTESSQQKSENKNVGGETKTGEGVVKKKIIKKKKIGTDKKDKSDSVSPAEKSVKESEVQAENAKQDNN